jgi:hypothetical protein
MSKKRQLINLETGLYFKVDGEFEKNHKLSWDDLKRIGDNTQKLISKLAKYSLSDNPLSEDEIKLVFIGFFKGSAIPAFDMQIPNYNLYGKESAFIELNNNLSIIMGHLNDGNFKAIADSYNEPTIKNEMIDTVYDFSNSVGTKPFSIVRPNKSKENEFKSLAKIRPINPTQKSILKVKVDQAEELPKSIDIEGVSKVILKTSKKGRTTKKISHLYIQKEATLSLKFDSIEIGNKLYVLNSELLVSLKEGKKSYTIESPMLDIYAFGNSLEEAENDLFEQFDFTYQRLNEFSDDKLSNHLLSAKKYINLLVGKVNKL